MSRDIKRKKDQKINSAIFPVFLFTISYIFWRYDKMRKSYTTFKWLYNHLKVA